MFQFASQFTKFKMAQRSFVLYQGYCALFRPSFIGAIPHKSLTILAYGMPYMPNS